MTRRLSIYAPLIAVLSVVVLFTMTACVVPDLSGRATAAPPSIGATMAEVRAAWGDPNHVASRVYGDTRVDVWAYRRSSIVVTPNFGGGHPSRHREYSYTTITFENGRVVGTSR